MSVTYAYECAHCGEFEWRQSIKDEALTTCPTCGGLCKRVIPKGFPAVHWIGWPHMRDVDLGPEVHDGVHDPRPSWHRKVHG